MLENQKNKMFEIELFEDAEAIGGRFWGWKKNSNKKLNFSNFACMCYGIFPTRNALKITFVFFQLQSIQHIVGAK